MRPAGEQASQARFEATLAAPFTVTGRGLHTNGRARVTVAPAPAGHGIRFRAADLPEGSGVALAWTNRVPSRLNTALRLPDGSRLRTVEHLAASLSAFGIDNALVTVEGRELPIFDGSARVWCASLAEAGRVIQSAPRRYVRVLRPVQIVAEQRVIRVEPSSSFALDVTAEHRYSDRVLSWRGLVDRATFLAELADSRSSGQISLLGNPGPIGRRILAPLLRPVGPAWLRREGDGLPPVERNRPRTDLPSDIAPEIARHLPHPPGEPVLRGAWPGRVTIWLGPWAVGGSRFPDERVRHNALDLLGDLMLAGAPLLARVVAHRPTHRLAYALVATLMQRTDAWEWWPGETAGAEGPRL